MTPGEPTTLAFALAGIIVGAIFGPSLSWIAEDTGQGRSLHDISAAAQSGRRPLRTRARSASSNGELEAWVLGAIVVIVLYVRWRPWILAALATLGATIGLAAFIVAFIAWARHIIAGTKTVVFCLLMPFSYSATGIVIAALLWRSPHASTGVLQSLTTCHLQLKDTGLEGLQYIACSFAGGVLYVILALSTLHWQMAVVAAIYAAEGVRPNRLWRTIASRLSLPLHWSWVIWGIVVATLALLFSGGWIYSWLSHLQK